MKLSNVVIRICYIVALIYLCYITYQHKDTLIDQFQKTLIENFQITGIDLANLTKKNTLASFDRIAYKPVGGKLDDKDKKLRHTFIPRKIK